MTTDPVLERRRRIAGLVQVGKRLGYGLFLAAIVLAPAIVFGYAVKAAEREDRLARGSSDPPG